MVADIALIVTAVDVFAAVFGLRQSNRERLWQFEAMSVQRLAPVPTFRLDHVGIAGVTGQAAWCAAVWARNSAYDDWLPCSK